MELESGIFANEVIFSKSRDLGLNFDWKDDSRNCSFIDRTISVIWDIVIE